MTAITEITARRRGQNARGFTLVEVLIVVVIIGVLMAIAIPSYQQYVLRTYRSDAEANLQAFAQAMERYYLNENSYEDAIEGTTYPDQSPVEGTAQYDLTVVTDAATTGAVLDGQGYLITATPSGAVVLGKVPTATLNHLGIKTGWQ